MNKKNSLTIISRSGENIDPSTYPGLHCTFNGSGSSIYIEEARLINKLYITVGSNCTIIIKKDLVIVDILYICMSGNESTLLIGEHVDFIKTNIFMWDDNLNVEIGNNCLFGADTCIRCGDGHTIYDMKTLAVLNIPNKIIIGNHVWFGYGSTILKNSSISNDCIVAERSIVTKVFTLANCILAGIPANIVRTGINWTWDKISDYKKHM